MKNKKDKVSDMEKIKFTLNSLASTFHSYLELNKDTNKLQDFMDKKYKEILKEKEKTKVPYPKRSITSSNFDTTGNSQYQVLSDLEETYKDYPGFKFENSLGTLLVTAPDGTKKYISMNRTLGGNKESRDEIQSFIAKHAKTK